MVIQQSMLSARRNTNKLWTIKYRICVKITTVTRIFIIIIIIIIINLCLLR